MVGSVVMTVSEGELLSKGAKAGYFIFGGSTVLLLFKRGTVRFDSDLLRNSMNSVETLVQMGEQIGKYDHNHLPSRSETKSSAALAAMAAEPISTTVNPLTNASLESPAEAAADMPIDDDFDAAALNLGSPMSLNGHGLRERDTSSFKSTHGLQDPLGLNQLSPRDRDNASYRNSQQVTLDVLSESGSESSRTQSGSQTRTGAQKPNSNGISKANSNETDVDQNLINLNASHSPSIIRDVDHTESIGSRESSFGQSPGPQLNDSTSATQGRSRRTSIHRIDEAELEVLMSNDALM